MNTAISPEAAAGILQGPDIIPLDVTEWIEEQLESDLPIVNADAFNSALADLLHVKPGKESDALSTRRLKTFTCVAAFATSSFAFAKQLAGDVKTPRPGRLHERMQAVQNIHDDYFTPILADPRDRVMPAVNLLREAGSAHAAAYFGDEAGGYDLHPHRVRVARNLLAIIEPSVLSREEKQVAQLLIEEDSIAKALRHHGEENVPLYNVVTQASKAVNNLVKWCPADFQDRLPYQILTSRIINMAAHTQRARHLSADTKRVRRNVRFADRYGRNGKDLRQTSDRYFSEKPEDLNTIRFNPAHAPVLRGIFGDLADQFIASDQAA